MLVLCLLGRAEEEDEDDEDEDEDEEPSLPPLERTARGNSDAALCA